MESQTIKFTYYFKYSGIDINRRHDDNIHILVNENEFPYFELYSMSNKWKESTMFVLSK